ncbi:arylamine N-acetyltransferase family protein [Burkholderia multivorans]|uniref:arylamine N-acetyltransferase family protein n=1 Tax=Burkholderia multivorans TaxID=87883 RepID=UPI002019D427|nr:arylamine N-acetyltransferase [Burkholderia multivorans]MCL4649981.1 arylamine N-acetyltransferase [Burkholderia multivorans]MCL4658843.1 arylamine N-acetyltransferase [Burkholderia multivorans]MCO1424769.1 arylamine N-acetyltransferase [Burkholderia multivorans]UQN54679.1 arylamine N-acetyltransferase [Burkholderia multivorans]UQN80395.1 arylamine N-acetyltransferase [Burkholderia multivorans]
MTGPHEAPDLAGYFKRIGYQSAEPPAGPTFDTLCSLHRLHPEAIPFENLDVLLGRPVRIDLASIQRKLVQAGRGGYCFEHNLLFRHVLELLGYTVRSYAARVLWSHDASLGMPPRTHMILVVEVDGERYLTDVGFGGMTLSAPLLLQTNLEQTTPHGVFRIQDSPFEAGADRAGLPAFVLQVQLEDQWKPVYRFDFDPQHPVDYDMSNHFVSTYPSSVFVSNLLGARLAPGRRIGLFNHTLHIHDQQTGTHKRELSDVQELRSVLHGELGITLPEESAALDAALARLP